MEVTYTNHEGFYLPNLTLPRKEEASFGRYGRLRLKYLKEHRKVLYICFVAVLPMVIYHQMSRQMKYINMPMKCCAHR